MHGGLASARRCQTCQMGGKASLRLPVVDESSKGEFFCGAGLFFPGPVRGYWAAETYACAGRLPLLFLFFFPTQKGAGTLHGADRDCDWRMGLERNSTFSSLEVHPANEKTGRDSQLAYLLRLGTARDLGFWSESDVTGPIVDRPSQVEVQSSCLCSIFKPRPPISPVTRESGKKINK